VPDSRKPVQSTLSRTRIPSSGRILIANTMPASPIGILIRKIQCQLRNVVRNPPTGGPTIGPTSAGIVSQAMALTSCDFSVDLSSTSRPTGVIIAPPMPCRKRAATNSMRLPEMAQAIDPARKTPIAMAKMRRAPKRSAIQPEIGMKIASDTR
jgi:hypothetical protein